MAEISKSAKISDCGLFRYELTRRWGDGPTCTFVMLNPSTADASVDDPTIRRCIGFAKREGCGALKVVNLFAYRATKPTALLTATDPEGPENGNALVSAVADSDGPVIAAWGAWPGARGAGRAAIKRFSDKLQCLGRTKDGWPRHPLYVRADEPLQPLAKQPGAGR